MQPADEQILLFGEFEVDPRKRSIARAGEQIPLGPKAFDLLLFFVRNPGRVISKDEVLDEVWSDRFVEQSNLTVQIHALRKVLGENGPVPQFLVTIPGRGYQFIAPVTHRKTLQEPRAFDHPKQPQNPATDHRGKRSAIIVAAAGLVVLVAGAFWIGRIYIGGANHATSSLAVLPFSNQTGDPDADYLADGLAESVIFSLSEVQDLKVLSRDSSFRFSDNLKDAVTVGRELGVKTILSGRITRSGNAYIVSAELISTEDGIVVWGEQFTREVQHLEKLQRDISQAIARKLRLRLVPTDAQLTDGTNTNDSEAYQFYLAGRYHLGRLTDDGFMKARDSFQSAIAEDPNYGLAHVGLAESYNLLSGWGAMEPNDGYPFAKAAATHAIELDDGLAEAHVQLGIVRLFYDFDWKRADEEFVRAIELKPGLSDAHHMYAYALIVQGRVAEAENAATRALELDPLSLLKVVSKGNIYFYDRRFDDAIEQYNTALQMEPNSGLSHWAMGNALIFDTQYERAIHHLQTSVRLSGDSPDEPVSLALAYARVGNADEARRIAAELGERSKTVYVAPTLLAIMAAALGDNDTAFEYLEAAVRRRDSTLVFIKVDPLFDQLAADQRFTDLVKRVGLP